MEAVGTCRDGRAGGPEWRRKGCRTVTGTAFLLAMVGGRLQAFWKHGVQVWAPGSDQVCSSIPRPTTRPSLLSHLIHEMDGEDWVRVWSRGGEASPSFSSDRSPSLPQGLLGPEFIPGCCVTLCKGLVFSLSLSPNYKMGVTIETCGLRAWTRLPGLESSWEILGKWLNLPVP